MSAGGREAWANDLSYAYAAGGMLSTAEDLVRFGVALNHARLVNRGSLAQMYETLLDPVMRYEDGGVPSRMDFQQGFIWRIRVGPGGRRYFATPVLSTASMRTSREQPDPIVESSSPRIAASRPTRSKQVVFLHEG